MDNNKIGSFIANLRKQKKLTQQELGDKLFVTDKAVSKWERGLSLPDISILEKLADVLETDIYSILQIEKNKNIDMEKILEEERRKMSKKFNKRIICSSIIFIIIIITILFKILPFGYDVIHVEFLHNTIKTINLPLPKFSFYGKQNDESYSYKSLRGKTILISEIKKYLNTMDYLSCNNTIYYYDEFSDTTIVDYSVKGNLLYSTISFNVKNGNYCEKIKRQEYYNKLGKLNTYFTYKSDSLTVLFLPNWNGDSSKYTATMLIYSIDENGSYDKLEDSSGTFEIADDELIYYREKINEDSKVDVPTKTTFIIKKHQLILKDGYLSDYERGVVLK